VCPIILGARANVSQSGKSRLKAVPKAVVSGNQKRKVDGEG
jgi:hypothetical protein